MNNRIAAALAAVVLGFGGSAAATELSIFADGRGWIDSRGFALGGAQDSNYISGFYCVNGNCDEGVVESRNYFTFTLPELTENLVSAVLEVDTRWLRPGDAASLNYQVTSTRGFTFDLLGGGDSYGLQVYQPADDETVQKVSLNGAALDAILNAGGGSFTLSGRVLPSDGYDGEYVHFVFGNTHDASTASTRLILTTAAVPEPATWGLMIGGFGLAGGALRRRQLI